MSVFSLEQLLQQEQDNRFKQFDFSTAWLIGQAIHDRAISLNAPVAIEVFAFGQCLFLSALPGSCADNLEWMKRKRNTVLRMAHASLYSQVRNTAKGTRMDQMPWIDQANFCDHGGSFPLFFENGAIFGAVTVSGLPSEEDHALSLWGIQQAIKQA